MKKLSIIRKFALLLVLMFALSLGGCLEEVVMSIEAEGNMSMMFADSDNRYLWGDGRSYNSTNATEAQLFTLIDGVVDVAAGDNFALWLTTSGLFYTGLEDGAPYGQYSGSGAKFGKPMKIVMNNEETYESPVEYNLMAIPDDFSSVTQIAAGSEHTLLLKSDGTVWAWGMNALGQLGQGTAGIAIRNPVRVGSLDAVKTITTGRLGCSAAVDMSGHVWVWGGSESLSTPTVVEGIPDKIAVIDAGDDFWVMLDADYNVWTWSVDDMTPRMIDELPDVWTVAAGDDFVVAIDSDRNVWTWGGNAYGQLARDTGGERDDTPAKASGISDVFSVSAGSHHVMAVRKDGSVWLWGSNSHGQLGNGTTEDSVVPLKLKKLTTRVG